MAVLVCRRGAAVVEGGAVGLRGAIAVAHRGCRLYRQRRAVATKVLGRPAEGREGGIARDRGARRRVHGGQLALALPARRKAIRLSDGRLVAAFGQGRVLEGDCALNVFAGEYGRVLPVHEDADVGHDRGRGRGRGLQDAGSSSGVMLQQHGSRQALV